MTDLRFLLIGLVELEREAGERAAEREGEPSARLWRIVERLEWVRGGIEALAREEGEPERQG